MHPNEIDFRDNENLVLEYKVYAANLGKNYEGALTEQLSRQGLIERKTKLSA